MIKSRTKRFSTVMLGAGIAAILIGAPLAASATAYSIGSTNEIYNETHYYATTRYHSGAYASFNLASHSGMCGSTFWIALRNSAGDSTTRNHFNYVARSQFFTWNNGSQSIPAAWYAITARNDCAGMPGATYNWAGTLHLNS